MDSPYRLGTGPVSVWGRVERRKLISARATPFRANSPSPQERHMDVMEPKEAFAEARKVIEKRGGMPKGKTVAFLWDF